VALRDRGMLRWCLHRVDPRHVDAQLPARGRRNDRLRRSQRELLREP
jgi:hypothetical protein